MIEQANVWRADHRTLRVFGVAGLVVFGVLGALAPSPYVAAGCWSIAVALGLGAALAPEHLRTPYALLSLITMPIGFVLSNVALAILYFGVLTPIGFCMRLVGRDPLRLQQTGGWRKRETSRPVRHYYRQY